jgi:murein DD-endopeptidase MepM/ murein hydrolase activator NlpD
VLAERLAAIVAQDQSDRQAQLQQNLAAAALHYAESGAFEQAVQIAQHAALPPELQAEILAEINTIAAEQTGQSQIAGQPAAVIQATLDTVATPSGLAVAPEQAQPQFSSARWRAQPDSTTWRYCPATPQPAAAPEARAIAAATDPKPARSMLKLGAAANLPSIAPATVQTLQSVERSVREKQFEFKLALRVDAPSATPIAAAQVAPQSMRSSSLNGVIAAQSVAVPALQVAAPEVMPPQTQQPTIHATSSRIVQAAIQAADAPAPITEGRLPTAAIVTQMLNQLSQAELPTTIAAITAPKAANKTIAPTATAALPEASRSSNSSGSPCTPARGRSVWSRLNQLNLRLPLPVPAVITSVFGWRTHPITGDQRFHAGIDIGAPMGTPVLAARSGQVVVADRMGGYGITVMLEDETASVRNLYAHLSGIAVQPGAWVEQGTVIGWVGSTGNSTGPHLHFETRQRTAEGWIAVDPIDAELAIPADRVAQANRE